MLSNSQVIHYPPANNPNEINNINEIEEEEDYPIIRCDNCHEVLLMSLDLDKKNILLSCEKENKKKTISFIKFFDNIDKYKYSNCCQLCKKKSKSQKYYLCKTCSNKIICQNCYEKHNKDDNIEKLTKLDSLCRKHFNQIESFCDICKEHKCSYCIPEHEEEHEDKEYLIRDILFKKKKLDNFKNNLKNISEMKQNIEKQINEVINQLQTKIELLIKLKNKFYEDLNMKIKFTDLVYKNYLKKFKDTDLNYYLIKNLENQIDFGLKDLKINKENNLDNRITQIINYLNSNINSHFNIKSDINLYEEENNNFNDIKENDAIDIDYNIKKQFNYLNILGILDFNDDLYAIYDDSLLRFISKKNDMIKFEIKEKDLSQIKSCQKNEENKILVLTEGYLIFIKILENSDYIILNKNQISIGKFEFNSSLNLLFYYYYNIYFLLFPKYNEQKFLLEYNNQYINKFQFIRDNLFFIFESGKISSYLIKDDKAKQLNSTNQFNIDTKYSEVIDLNSGFYALNNKDKIYILNKNNLEINKTININLDKLNTQFYYYSSSIFTTLFKSFDTIITLFIFDTYNKIVDFQNYKISMSGIKWELEKEKNVISDKIYALKKLDNNNLLFLGNNKSYLVDIQFKELGNQNSYCLII